MKKQRWLGPLAGVLAVAMFCCARTDDVDSQRRAEILLQRMLSLHPQSDKITDAAYMLGDIYESKAYKQYDRAALYYERCYQWHPRTRYDARLRAARLYERHLNNRG